MLNYINGDLLKLAPKKAYLLHACNCKGSWGSGVARQIQFHYPFDYIKYKKHCELGKAILGTSLITTDKIINLFISDMYGKFVADPVEIIANTNKALTHLSKTLKIGATIYSPKINSGLFRTPWELTEQAILLFLEQRQDVTWTVVNYSQ